MKLQSREKILAAVTAGLLLALGIWFVFFSGSDLSYAQLAARRQQLADQVVEKETKVKMAGRAARQLDDWQHCALPSNTSDARVAYQAWLRKLADRCKFAKLKVDSAGDKSWRDIYTLFTFNVKGRTKIEKLVEFLHEFYSAGHLHQIRRLELKTIEKSPDLDVSISVEAMSLPGADRVDKLAKKPDKAPLAIKLSEYRNTITKRNLFATPRPPSDAAATTSVSAITASGDHREVWLTEKNAGQQWTLSEDDSFQVGSLQGIVKTIGTENVIIEVDEKLRRFRCGDNLRGGKEIKAEDKKTKK